MMGEYLTSSEAAEMLRIKAKTLNNMKARGPFLRRCPFLPETRPRPSLEARCARTAGWKREARTTEAFPSVTTGWQEVGGLDGCHRNQEPVTVISDSGSSGKGEMLPYQRDFVPTAPPAATPARCCEGDSDRREIARRIRTSPRAARRTRRLPAATDAGTVCCAQGKNRSGLLSGVDCEKDSTTGSPLHCEEEPDRVSRQSFCPSLGPRFCATLPRPGWKLFAESSWRRRPGAGPNEPSRPFAILLTGIFALCGETRSVKDTSIAFRISIGHAYAGQSPTLSILKSATPYLHGSSNTIRTGTHG